MTKNDFITLIEETGLDLKFESFLEPEGHYMGDAICGFRVEPSEGHDWTNGSLIIFREGTYNGKFSNKKLAAKKLIYEELAYRKSLNVQNALKELENDFQ